MEEGAWQLLSRWRHPTVGPSQAHQPVFQVSHSLVVVRTAGEQSTTLSECLRVRMSLGFLAGGCQTNVQENAGRLACGQPHCGVPALLEGLLGRLHGRPEGVLPGVLCPVIPDAQWQGSPGEWTAPSVRECRLSSRLMLLRVESSCNASGDLRLPPGPPRLPARLSLLWGSELISRPSFQQFH